MRTLSRLTGIATALSLACIAAVVQAGPLPLNPDALAGYKGTTTASSGLIAGHTLDVSIDFAVFAPGQFNAYFGAGADPSNGTQFVYAYEITNTGLNAAIARNINGYTVGLLPTAMRATSPTCRW